MRRNNKGFTLIELLAVIVILGVILALAIPAVAQYINSAKKSTYVDNAQSYASAARNELFLNDSSFALPVGKNHATVISFKNLSDALESGGKKSPYGGDFLDNSYVIIVQYNEPSNPKFKYYIAAIDGKGYGIADADGNATAVLYDELSEGNIKHVGGNGVPANDVIGRIGVEAIENDYTSTGTGSSTNGG